jgi:KaiC/GvpD/RAD55 family RecA-like ATPase
MSEADSFKVNFGRAGDEPKNIAVDVSADRSSGEQPCFVDLR